MKGHRVHFAVHLSHGSASVFIVPVQIARCDGRAGCEKVSSGWWRGNTRQREAMLGNARHRGGLSLGNRNTNLMATKRDGLIDRQDIEAISVPFELLEAQLEFISALQSQELRLLITALSPLYQFRRLILPLTWRNFQTTAAGLPFSGKACFKDSLFLYRNLRLGTFSVYSQFSLPPLSD